ncbi:metal ABC transporter substrate-binding protein [Sulfurimonas sp.]|uniref:metal ABC transporter substrate-binding protein n=1 Tax=Sulfurimonas sp. TaxID=2022749 RepID=UPI00260BE48C|nr:metal ABC transporter substrate-binding protein [Sulfurimonas sp.]MDD5157678.1 metal ABC transporter substrate-binding protein [Sulfurimonas sp.]
MSFKNIVIALTIFQLFITNQILYASSQKPLVATSTFSLYDITKHIAMDRVDTYMILPVGVDIHSYEPTPREMIKLYKSDLVIYSGAGLEPWIKNFEFKKRVINMSLYVKLIKLKEDNEGHGHHHHDSEMDPHYWQDLQNMIKATEQITKELAALSPQNREFYAKNRDAYVTMLKKLDSDYKSRLKSCRLDTIIVNHNAFSYLSNNYGFSVKALSGFSTEVQPSAKDMAALIEFIKKYKQKTIFFENFTSDKVMKSIAKEAKVGVWVLQPLENITADEVVKKLSFEDIMRDNLTKISKSLECR